MAGKYNKTGPSVRSRYQGTNKRTISYVVIATMIVIYGLYSLLPGKRINDSPVYHYRSWKTQEFVPIPDNILADRDKVKIKATTLTFSLPSSQKEVKVYIQEAGEASTISVLLLHGMSFTSANWVKLKTVASIAAMGYHVVAVDLPGWGESQKDGLVDGEKVEFMEQLLIHTHLHRPVIVSPSMSGSFSVPYIMSNQPNTCTERIAGFVPVAPVGTERYMHSQYYRCEVPTLIVYGSKDTSLGLESAGNLRNLANNEIHVMENASHPCYLDNPDEWHKLLYNFLIALN